MPQASKELRSKFPDGMTQAIELLYSHGFFMVNWKWQGPKGYVMTKEDEDALQYLFEEWDF